MDIYIDVLFVENLIINYCILLITKKIMNVHSVKTRMVISSVIGAIYVLLMLLFPNLKLFYTIFSKIILSIIMVFISFNPKSILEFIKTSVFFYMSAFVVAGCMLCMICLSNKGGLLKSGAMYMIDNPKKSVIVFSILIIFVVVKVLISGVKAGVTNNKLIVPLNIMLDNRNINVRAMLDTGASLNEPFSNLPIILVEFKSIEEILPIEIKDIFINSRCGDLDFITNKIANSKWFKRFRIIPFNSIGNKNGILLGFRADSVKSFQIKKIRELKNVIVAIYDELLTNNNSYEALIGLDLYNKLI